MNILKYVCFVVIIGVLIATTTWTAYKLTTNNLTNTQKDFIELLSVHYPEEKESYGQVAAQARQAMIETCSKIGGTLISGLEVSTGNGEIASQLTVGWCCMPRIETFPKM